MEIFRIARLLKSSISIRGNVETGKGGGAWDIKFLPPHFINLKDYFLGIIIPRDFNGFPFVAFREVKYLWCGCSG